MIGGGFAGPDPSFGTPDGVFYFNSNTNLAQITDGTSNTVLMSESIVGNGTATATVPPAAPDPTNIMTLFPGNSPVYMPLTPAQCCRPDPVVLPAKLGLGARRLRAHALHALHDAEQHGVRLPATAIRRLEGLRSRHPGGVNVLVGDGSVKFVKNSVSLYRLASPGHPRGWRNHQ